MSYTFVLRDKGTLNQGWWLKISTLEELTDYHKSTWRYAYGFERILYDDEVRYDKEDTPSNRLGMLMHLRAEHNNQSKIDSAVNLQTQVQCKQAEFILKGYNVYINRYGGWCFGEKDYSDWVRREKMIFPDFKRGDIEIKQFNNGQHYYAYIDGMQVRDGDTLKWDTRQEAYNYALSYCCEENE